MTNVDKNIPGQDYQNLLGRISETYESGYERAVAAVNSNMVETYFALLPRLNSLTRSVNSNMVETYWKIGQYIVEFEQFGKLKAEYGKALLTNLSKDLSVAHGKGFSLSNVYMMRQFFIKYPIFQTVSGIFDRLTWSHFCELIPIDNELERQFYEVQSQKENWNVRELKRLIETQLKDK